MGDFDSKQRLAYLKSLLPGTGNCPVRLGEGFKVLPRWQRREVIQRAYADVQRQIRDLEGGGSNAWKKDLLNLGSEPAAAESARTRPPPSSEKKQAGKT